MMLLYSPFPSLEAARAACQLLLDQRAVGCCNLLPGAESHYLWEGKPTTANEVILIAKTTEDRAKKARDLLAASHPYECPAILSFEASANPEFAAFLANSGR